VRVFNSLLISEITDCGSAVATYESVVFIMRGHKRIFIPDERAYFNIQHK
jgi:hypothetical protein